MGGSSVMSTSLISAPLVWAGIQRKSERREPPMKSHGTTRENLRDLASTEVNALDDLPVNPADVRDPWGFGTTPILTLTFFNGGSPTPQNFPAFESYSKNYPQQYYP